MLVPGRHTVNRIEGRPQRNVSWPDPSGAVEVCAEPGDVVLFDRRLWHAHSENRSTVTRKRSFSATPTAGSAGGARATDVRRQLLGCSRHQRGPLLGHDPASVPLYEALRRADQFDV